jgi:IS5 family transposase
MKAHIGVDVQSGLEHSVSGTAAKVADIAQTHELLHREEKKVFTDAGYLRLEKGEENATTAPGLEWHITAKRDNIRAMVERFLKEPVAGLGRLKA